VDKELIDKVENIERRMADLQLDLVSLRVGLRKEMQSDQPDDEPVDVWVHSPEFSIDETCYSFTNTVTVRSNYSKQDLLALLNAGERNKQALTVAMETLREAVKPNTQINWGQLFRDNEFIVDIGNTLYRINKLTGKDVT